MNTQEKFYIYEHVRPDTGAVFYVGKGCRDRAFRASSRNEYWNRIVKKAGGFKVSFVCSDSDEEFIMFAEQERIDQLKRLGISLCNVTAGGDGLSGMVLTKEHKQKIAQTKIGVSRPPEVVEKVRQTKTGKLTGADNPFFGKHHSEETKAKLRTALSGRVQSEEEKQRRQISRIEAAKKSLRCRAVYCITNGQTYFSISEACRQLNLHRNCVTMVCNKEMHHTAGYKFEWSKK
jgi:hypothetical protein